LVFYSTMDQWFTARIIVLLKYVIALTCVSECRVKFVNYFIFLNDASTRW